MTSYESEESMEQHLLRQLTEQQSQWTLREDLHTIQDLWDNFRRILVNNNKELFDAHPLTDGEFLQVQNQLRFPTFYDGAKWMLGENGVARVDIQREDASLGTIHPVVFKRVDVAGGSSVYEVVHQIQFPRKEALDRNRRGDVTLLINGLPMIHIELKNRAHPYMEAFNQIKKYLKEGVFRDIFSTLQMFVVSNGTDTRYIAAAAESSLNPQFLSLWLDDKNQPQTDYLSFAREVLSIPAAHRMVSQYTVLDSERKAIILLRPYQIHAIEAVKNAVNPYTDGGTQSGFIWHTTGSGKTLTSYKTAHYLTQIPSVDKVIFVVDRKDLDNQTTGAFQAYAQYDTIDVNETDNTGDLVRKLQAKGGDVIVTTIQKLQIVMKRYPEGCDKYEKLHKLRLVFVVDECHRAVSPAAQAQLDLVIVVDRLLTGFDAPCLSTLFIDRKPMRSYGIIQAFSRTNRLFDSQKRFGQIVTFQVPAHFKRAVDEAMKLYSAGGGSFVQAPDWEEAEKKFREALGKLRQIASRPEAVDGLTKKQKIAFLKAFRDFDDAYGDIQVYSEFQDRDLERDYQICEEIIEGYSGKFNNVKEELKKDRDDGGDEEINIVVNYQLRCWHRDQIDEDYILKLMEATRPDESALMIADSAKNQKIFQEIAEEIERFRKTNPARAQILEEIWQEYRDNPAAFVNQSFVDVMNDRVRAKAKAIIDSFAQEWCVDPEALEFFMETYDAGKDPHDKQVNQDALKKNSHVKEYRQTHPDIGLKYWGNLLGAIRTMYVEKLQKLIEQ